MVLTIGFSLREGSNGTVRYYRVNVYKAQANYQSKTIECKLRNKCASPNSVCFLKPSFFFFLHGSSSEGRLNTDF